VKAVRDDDRLQEARTTVSAKLTVRLAQCEAEIDAAQALRYRVFFEDLSAKADPQARESKRDRDAFDDVCDHLLAIDEESQKVVGTYRLLRRARAQQKFYSAAEYDLGPLLTYPGEVVELGRSCVDPAYRGRAVMQLMWKGIADYVSAHEIEVMFGCASFHGTELSEIRGALAYLHRYHLAPLELCPRARPERFIALDSMGSTELDEKAAMAALPPLIKGYLRLGGFVGDGAVIDHDFNTIDVCVIVRTEWVVGKYVRHFKPGPQRADLPWPGSSVPPPLLGSSSSEY
jgi:putative hemolysin